MNVPSLEGILDMIQEAVNLNAASINVVYDVDAGYPTSVYVDYDERIADEELSIVVDYLAPVGQWQSDLVQGKSTREVTGLATYTYVYQRTSTNTTQEEATTITTIARHLWNHAETIISSGGRPAVITTVLFCAEEDIWFINA
jgi:hypothetical protein